MPRLIDFGGKYGVVSFPDDATDDQIVEQYRTVTATPPPSVSDYLQQGVGSFIRGVGSTIGAIPEGIGISRDAVRNLVPETLRPAYDVADPLAIADLPSRITGGAVPTLSRMLRGAGEAIRTGTEAIAPEQVPGLEESFFASRVPQGLGSLVGFAVPGGIISKLTRMPLWLSTSALGSAVGGAEFYQDARASGADQDTAEIASLVGNVVGTSEALPISKMLRRLDGITGGTFTKFVMEAGKDTFEEALQEGVQQLAQNITAQQLYDQDRELFRDVFQNAGVGGVTGFLASAISQAIGIPIGRSRMRREGEQRRREVIAQEVAQGRLLPERTDATTLRTITQTPGPQERILQGEDQPLRVRDPAQIGMEAQTGAPIAQEPDEAIPAPRPVQRIPIQIQSADGSIREGEFNGYYDMRSLGRGTVPSVGWRLPDGSMTHGMLTPGEQIIGTVPTFEEWQSNPAFGNLRSDSEEAVERQALFVELDELKSRQNPTLENVLQITVKVAARHNTSIEGGIRLLIPFAANLGGTVKFTFNDSENSSYRSSTNTINLNPNTFTSRTVMHEAIHALTARYISRHLGDDVLMGGEIRTKLRQRRKDKYLPEPVRNLIDIYFAAAKGLGIEKELFGGVRKPGIVSRPILASKAFRSNEYELTTYADSKERQDYLDKALAMIEARYGAIRREGNSSFIGENQINQMIDDGIVEMSGGGAWITIPMVEAGVPSRGVAGTGGLAHTTASAGLPYGMANLDEFLAEAFTNQEFQLLLDSLPSQIPGKSIWSRFLDWLKSVFPFFKNEPSLLADAISTGEQIFRQTAGLLGVPYKPFKAEKKKRIEADLPIVDLGENLLPAPISQPPTTPQFFQSRQQVEAAVQNPGLDPSQQQQVRDLAAVQSSMSPQSIVGWLMQTPRDAAERFAQKKLDYIETRRHMSDLQRSLVTMPEGTPDEIKAKEVVSAQILGHYGIDRATEREIGDELEHDRTLMEKAITKIGKLNNNQLKANFLTALFNRMTRDYRVYLNDLMAAAPSAGNLQSVYQQNLAAAERRLNEQAVSPIAAQRALSAIASNIPANLLAPGTTNQQMIDWINQNGTLNDVVGQDVRTWLLLNDGTGSPALLGYTRFREDMATLREVLQNQQAVRTDIQAFEEWFKSSGRPGKVSAKNFAENYFKFRTARDRAVKVVTAIEKEIDNLDTRIRGNGEALRRLQAMMVEAQYVSTVREAARKAHVVVRALYESQSQKTGLVERDKTIGRWRLTGPITGEEVVVDLYPSATSEAQNRHGLTAFSTEARLYAEQHAQDNPLLSDEYNNLADYIEKYLIHPSLDPAQGFIQEPWMQIPGTTIRITTDPFDIWSDAFGGLFSTIRDTLERIGGRVVRQAVLDAHELDRVMRKVEGVNANPKYGYAAQSQAVLRAIESHGWSTEQFARWDQDIAERVLAAGQNNLGPTYEVGDRIIGSGVELTSEDVAALKIMKQWEDAVLAVAPKHVQEQLGDLGIIRKAIGSGRFTMARVAAPWIKKFMIDWTSATTDEAKWQLLSKAENVRRVILGHIGEFNPEFAKMNPASPNKSTLFEVYRRLALTEKSGIQSFFTVNEILDFLANEMVDREIAPDVATARTKAQETLLTEIKGFVKAFEDNVINYKSTDIYGGVPPSVVQIATANNSFTIPRGQLVAPSTFYTYSTASDGRRLNHVGSLRSLLNLKLLQSGHEARAALEAKKTEMDERIQRMIRQGVSRRKAIKDVLKQTTESRKSSEIRYDYKELIEALSALDKVFSSLERFEASTASHYEHAGVAALNNVFGTIKAFLLSSTQAITTNYWSGTLLGPAIFHWQTGQYTKALKDVAFAPHFWKTVMKRVSAAVASNPMMASLLRRHAPFWNSLAENIVRASVDWRRLQQIAEQSGMVTPYNLGKINANKKALKRTAGRLELDDPHVLMEFSNTVMSLPVARHLSEGVKAFAPRLFDNMINYSLIASFDKDMEFVAKNGWLAFQAREEAARASGADWTDLSNPDNILLPGDLGLKSFKGLETYRNLFLPLGSLDAVLLDYYQRTKDMSKEEREQVALIEDPSSYAALALEYAAITNVATETRRSFALKGKGSDGLWRNILGTFMGWVTNMTKQFSKAMQTHSKDPQAGRIWQNMVGLATIILLLSVVGAWNWEFGDELTKLFYNQSSARIQPGNIQDVETGMLYFLQALVNTVPVFGPSMGNLAGLAFTGRGQPFDPASLMPIVGFALGSWNTVKRIVQTGDVVLPMADWSRQWMPFSKILINRAPIISGLVEQNNAVRSLNASAPPGTEIRWGQRMGGELRYSPANDEIMKLISSAYDVVSRGGNVATVQARLQDAINAYVATGRTAEESQKLVISALSAKEPIRILTGKEMTPEEEQRWIKRMTPEQLRDYEKAKAAWNVIGSVTGRDFQMVTTPSGGGGIRASGGGGGAVSPITGLRRTRTGGLLRLARPAAMSLNIVPGIPRATIPSIPRLARRRRTGRRLRAPRARRIRSPRIRTRRATGLRRRLRYSLARA